MSLRCCISSVNILILLPGLLLIAVGCIALKDPYLILVFLRVFGADDEVVAVANFVNKSKYMLLVVGSIIAWFSLIGLCGVFCYSRLLVSLYAITIFFLLVMAFICSIFVMSPAHVRPTLQNYLYQSLRFYKGDETMRQNLSALDESVTFLWNFVQVKMNCCGAYNYTDYFIHSHVSWIESRRGVPRTCCKKLSTHFLLTTDYEDLVQCRIPYLEPKYINVMSCYTAFELVIKNNPMTVIATICGTIVSLIVSIFLICVMVLTRKKRILTKMNMW